MPAKGRGRPRLGGDEFEGPGWTAAKQRQFKANVEAAKRAGDTDIKVSGVLKRLDKLVSLIDQIPPSSHGEYQFMLARQEATCFQADMQWLVEHAHYEAAASEAGDAEGEPKPKRSGVAAKQSSRMQRSELPRLLKRSVESQACPPVLDAGADGALLIDAGTGKPISRPLMPCAAGNDIHHSGLPASEHAALGESREANEAENFLVSLFGTPILYDIYCTKLYLSC